VGARSDRGTSNAVALSSLSKRFGSRVAVDGLDLRVPRGAVAGFVGPNGAGKTTTLRMILGLLRPSGGSGTVLGCPLDDPVAYLPWVGAVIDAPAFYPGLSGSDNLQWLAAAGRLDPVQIPAVLDRVGLADRARDHYRTFSMGMKQRLGIAAALLGDPELLILDEPTNGLDPSGIHDMRTLVRDLSKPDMTHDPGDTRRVDPLRSPQDARDDRRAVRRFRGARRALDVRDCRHLPS
jgi:ABC-2 type transport system ATP-binding protein